MSNPPSTPLPPTQPSPAPTPAPAPAIAQVPPQLLEALSSVATAVVGTGAPLHPPPALPAFAAADNGCATLNYLWSVAARDFDFERPGVTGVVSRISSWVEMERVPSFLQMAALKCWEERTRFPVPNGANPAWTVPVPPMFSPGPHDVAHARRSGESSGRSSAAVSNRASNSSSGPKN
jgi:hypothetical protein